MNDQNKLEVTSEGTRLIKVWLETRHDLEQTERKLAHNKDDLEEATRNLGAWLLPDDADRYEKISVWFGDSLIQAYFHWGVEQGDKIYTVVVRKRGKSLSEV